MLLVLWRSTRIDDFVEVSTVSPARSALPPVDFSEEGSIRHLHLGTPWIQGSMDLDDPLRLVHEYVQRMMAWLLFMDAATVPKRQAMQLGLGAAALTKFCAKRLRMKTVAIECNPLVLQACHMWFALPADGLRQQVVLADAAREIQSERWWGRIDALQVDLYDQEAAAPVLDSVSFYEHCRRLLSADGCMTVNLFGRASSFQRSVEKMASAFGAESLWSFKPTREGNTVVLAQRTAGSPKPALMSSRALEIERQWDLPARKWARILKPLAS